MAVPVAIALAGALLLAATNERDLVWRGNGFAAVAVKVKTGKLACQQHVDPSEDFNGVRFGVAGEGALPGPPVVVTVKRDGRTVGRGKLAPGYEGQAKRLVELDRRVRPDQDLQVCFFNRGGRTLLLYGSGSGARGRDVTVGGKQEVLALQLDLTREPRSALSMLGTVVERASLQRPAPAGPWLVWLLAVVVVVVVPALAIAAVRGAVEDEGRP